MPRISVLMIDDNRFFLRLAARFLENHGDFELVGSATSREEALSQAVRLRPQLVLLDLNLPQSSGLELLPQLRRVLPHAKIIILTLWDNPIYRQAALSAGADDFVPKSLMNSDLVPAMQRLRPAAPSFS